MPQAPQSLAGCSVVVTGINGLLGPVWAEALLAAGATVWGLDLYVNPPNAAISRLRSDHPGRLHLLAANVTDRASLEAVRAAVGEGAPEVLINNAGIDQPPRPGMGWKVEEFPWEDFKRVMDVNLGGAFLCSQVFGPAMISAGRGSIINIGSLYATVSPDARNYDHLPSTPPFLKPPAYGASKAGLFNLTKYLAAHWGPHGVRVNMLSPGGVEGGQDPEFKRKFCARVPLQRMATHADLVGPMLFLASGASDYVTGQNLQVDGGYTLW